MSKKTTKRGAAKRGGRKALGRGLSALISTTPVPVSPRTSGANLAEAAAPEVTSSPSPAVGRPAMTEGEVTYIDIDQLSPNPHQPRQEFAEKELRELAESIQSRGVLQPTLVRRLPDGAGVLFEIVAGERRWRACKIAGVSQIPVIIKEISDEESFEIALIENVQRSNLNPVEEGRAYQTLIDRLKLSQREVADRVGKDRASVANMLRLLKLPGEVLAYLKDGKISTGHAKAILSVKEPSAQRSLAKKVISEGLSVRALENIVSRVVVLDTEKQKRGRATKGKNRGPAQSDFPEVVDRLRSGLGTKVNIRHTDSGRGKIEIEYFSEEELDRICERILS